MIFGLAVRRGKKERIVLEAEFGSLTRNTMEQPGPMKFKFYDAEQRAMIDWLSGRSPDARHSIATHLNWDYAQDVLEWIVTRPDCDLATAAFYFWLSEPEYWIQYKIGDFQDEEYFQLKRLIDRAEAGFYARSEIRFICSDPYEDPPTPEFEETRAQELRDIAANPRGKPLNWTLPEILVPPFGSRPVLVGKDEDPRRSKELRSLFEALGAYFSD